MKKRLLSYLLMLVVFYGIAQQKQQDSVKTQNLQEVVITATKIPTEKKELGKIVYLINARTIEKNQGKSLPDLLNDAPGIEINGNYSTAGQNLGYYIRGGRNKQVTILIDGINVSDPSSFNNDFDLRQITLDQVEKIEIIKGAASTLYGTGAATGVINIILKKPNQKPANGSFVMDIGTNASHEHQNTNLSTLNTSVNVNGTLKKFNYLVSLSSSGSKGLSAAEDEDEDIVYEEDPFLRYNALVNIGYQVSDQLDFSVFSSYDEFTSHYDGFDFVTGKYADANNSLHSIQKRVGIRPTYTYKKGDIHLNAFYTQVDRNVDPTNDMYKGEAIGFDLYTTYVMDQQWSILTGVASQFQDMYQKTAFASIEEGSAKQHFVDPYVSINYFSKNGINLNAGIRTNIHSEYGSHLVYTINPSYTIEFKNKNSLKIFGSYSTAFIAPTLHEIFNKLPTLDALNPEKDKTLEGGFEWQFSNKFSMNVVYFYREETDKIGYDLTTFQTINDTGTFLARGFETEIQYSPYDKLAMNINYGYIDREESLLLKIPKHKVSLNVSYTINKSAQFSFQGKFVDATQDFGGIALPSYRVIDIFANHKLIADRCTLFASITNIFNEDFQEIAGFTTRGRNYKLGIKLNF